MGLIKAFLPGFKDTPGTAFNGGHGSSKKQAVVIVLVIAVIAVFVIGSAIPSWAWAVIAILILAGLVFASHWRARSLAFVTLPHRLALSASLGIPIFFLTVLTGISAPSALVCALLVASVAGYFHVLKWRDATRESDSEILRVKKILWHPRRINRQWYFAGLVMGATSQFATARIGQYASRGSNPLAGRIINLFIARTTMNSITMNGQRHLVPRILHIKATNMGPCAVLSVLDGFTEADYKAVTERLATALRIPEIRVLHTPHDRARGTMQIIFAILDPLAESTLFDLDVTESVSVYEPWVLGPDEYGDDIEVDLAGGAHIGIFGATRSGKSVTTYSLVTHILRMGPCARLLIADPNDTTVAPFEPLVSWSTKDQHPAKPTAMLEWVREEMLRRQPKLRELKRDKLEEFTAELPLIFVIIDEAANYMRHADKKAAAAFNDELMAVVSQGAKYGIRLVLITQRPDSTILPTSIRAQLSCRILHRVEDKQTALMAFPELEDPGAALTYAAGVGLYREVGGAARRFRGIYIEDHWAIAAQISEALPRIEIPDEDELDDDMVAPPKSFKLSEIYPKR